MRPEERLEIARLAYLRAIALARVSSTPASWRRALTASRNMGAAIRDQGDACRRAGGRPRTSPASAGPCAGPALAPSCPEPAKREPDGRRERPAAGGAPRGWTAETLAAAAVARERARTLIRESRRLVREARALSEEIRRLLAAAAAVARP